MDKDGTNHYEFYFLGGDNGRMVAGNALIGLGLYRFGDRGGPNEGRYMRCSSTGTDSGMPSRSFDVRFINLTGNESVYVDTAIGRWNGAGVGASITKNTTAASYVAMNRSSRPDTSLGVYERGSSASGFAVTLFDANITTSASQWGWNQTGKDKSDLVSFVAMHELGHALRLIDNPAPLGQSASQGSMASVMNHMAPPRVVSPTLYDKENVRKCYP
jgi:hypothetical protein